jgi:hypothetical protein
MLMSPLLKLPQSSASAGRTLLATAREERFFAEENSISTLSWFVGEWSTLYRKSDLCIPRNETAWPRSYPIPTFMYL